MRLVLHKLRFNSHEKLICVKRILLTGMSGSGKSTLIGELSARGFKAVDLDTIEFSVWVDVLPGTSKYPLPKPGQDWVWREDRVQQLLTSEDAEVLFVSGCAENMGKFLSQFDNIVLLSASPDVIVERLNRRPNGEHGKRPEELDQVMALLQSVEPRLRRIADQEIDRNGSLNDTVTALIQLAL
jgi:dephospho-CoA kinase